MIIKWNRFKRNESLFKYMNGDLLKVSTEIMQFKVAQREIQIMKRI